MTSNPARGKVQPLDNSEFEAATVAFRAYLKRCREQLSHNRPAPVKTVKLSATDKALAKYRSTHVYLLTEKRPANWQPCRTRDKVAPIWTSIQDAA